MNTESKLDWWEPVLEASADELPEHSDDDDAPIPDLIEATEIETIVDEGDESEDPGEVEE